MKQSFSLACIGLALLLGACGGGSSSNEAAATTTPGPSTVTFPLQQAYASRLVNGANESLVVSGSCSGTASLSIGLPVAANFEGQGSFSSTQTLVNRLSNCPQEPSVDAQTQYFDGGYTQIGSSMATGGMAKPATTVAAVPAQVKIGESGVLGTFALYSASSPRVVTGQRISSYVIEPGSSATQAIANFISKSYDASNRLLSTWQTRYRIDVNGALSLISMDLQYSASSTASLAYVVNTASSTSSFYPLRSAYAARIASGFSDAFTVASDPCSGTATLSAGAPVAASFEKWTGFSTSQTLLLKLGNCAATVSPGGNDVVGVSYYDAAYLLLGSSLPGSEYTVYSAAVPDLPQRVKVGDAALFEILNTYTDSSKLVPTGWRSISYAIDADAAATAIGSVITVLTTRSYNTANQLLLTQQARYRLDTAGALTMLSLEMQYATTRFDRWFFTRR